MKKTTMLGGIFLMIGLLFAVPQTTIVAATVQTCNGIRATRVGTSGNDQIIGTAARDVIVALEGNDLIYGLGGNDIICSNQGNDNVYS